MRAEGVPDAGALQQNLEKQLPAPSPLQLPAPSRAPAPQTEAPKPGEATVTVSSFDLEGVKLVTEDELQSILKPWLGKPITFTDLQKACDAIEEYYRSKGYMVEAIIPPQKVKDGVLLINVTEARLGHVHVETPEGESRFGPQRAAEYLLEANPLGEELDVEAIRRAIIILNETPGVSATSTLEEGKHEGETDVRVTLMDTPMFAGRIEGNNYGSRTTGSQQGGFSAQANNPSGYGDQATLNGIFSEGSRYAQAGYNFPLAPNGLRAGVYGTYLNYQNIGEFEQNGGYGSAWMTGINLAYPLVRLQETNVNILLNYDFKSYLNENTATQSTISDYQINDLTVGMSGNHYDGFFGGGVSSAQINLTYGNLDISDNSQPGYNSYVNSAAGLTRYTPTNFFKMLVSFTRNQVLIKDETNLIFSLLGQVASGNMNSAEQFYLGGPFGIRSYPIAQGNGSQGALGTIEIQQQLPGHFVGSTFFNAGAVQQYVTTYPGWQGMTHANNTYYLADTGMGLKWFYEGLSVAGMVAWKVGPNPLYSYTGQPVNIDNTTTDPRFWISGSYYF